MDDFGMREHERQREAGHDDDGRQEATKVGRRARVVGAEIIGAAALLAKRVGYRREHKSRGCRGVSFEVEGESTSERCLRTCKSRKEYVADHGRVTSRSVSSIARRVQVHTHGRTNQQRDPIPEQRAR